MLKIKSASLIMIVSFIGVCHFEIYAQDATAGKQANISNFGTSGIATFNNDVQDVSINYNTGVGNISVPIYQISSGPLSLPISLNYQTSGIKADQPSSDVGLGWQLSAGGNISRVVKNNPDENLYLKTDAELGITTANARFNALNTYLEYNYYSTNSNLNTFNTVNNVNDLYTTCTPSPGRLDVQPDLFTLNIPGKSIQFVFDQYRNPVLLDNSHDIKITFASNSFTIIDENGIKYFFSSLDVEKTNNYSSAKTVYDKITGNNYINFNSDGDEIGCLNYETGDMIVNWKLTKIETPDGKNSINFEYNSYDSWRMVSSNLAYNIDPATNTPLSPFIIGVMDCSMDPLRYIDIYYDFNQGYLRNKRLRKISWKTGTTVNGYILFDSDTQRHDVDETDSGGNQISFDKSLDFIKIFNDQNAELKRFALNYSYFNSAVTTSDPQLQWQNKRLKLNSVVEYSSDLSAKPAYTFSYDPTPIPIKFSYEQDFWGYYNGNNASTMQGMIYHNSNYSNSNTNDYALWSPLCIYPINFPGSGGTSAYSTITGANRLPNINYTKAGVLNKVIYPTGGSLSLDYESNVFRVDWDITNRLAGGLRLKTTTMYDGLNHSNDIIKNFYYTIAGTPGNSSGKINFLPSMGYDTRYVRLDGNYCYSATNHSYLADYYKISAYNVATSTTGQESIVYYDEVKVEEPGKGYTVYKYNNYGTFGHNNDLTFGGSPMISKTKTQSASWVPYPNPTDYPVFTQSEALYKNTNYPYTPEPNIEWAVGELKEVSIYDQSSVLKSKNVYSYSIKSFSKVHGYVTMPKVIFWGNNVNTSSIAASKYNYLSVWKVLNDETEYVYDPANAALSMSKTTNYEYTSTKHKFLTAKTTLDSKGITYRDEYAYVADYDIFPGTTPTDDPTLALYNMKLNHELSAPVENTSWTVSGSTKYLLGGSINLYKDFNNTVTHNLNSPYNDIITNNPCYNRISQQFQIEVQAPLISTSYNKFAFYISGSHTYYSLDSRVKRKLTYEKFDAFGNQIQIKKENGLRASTIYAYNNTLPVASVTNAMSTEIAHTSFEDISGFTINNSRIITTDKYNGVKCYDMFPAVNASTPNYDAVIDLSGANNQLSQNGKYTFSCWAKTGAGMAANKAYITIHTNDGTNLGTVFPASNAFAYQSIAIPNSTTWKYYQVDIDLGKIAASQILSLRAFFVNNSTTDHFYIDEVRLRPSNSFMETSTYKSLIGITSKTDAKNYTEFYEYDPFWRTKLTRDFNTYIISKTYYNYKP